MARSPYASHSAHGTHTAASPQMAVVAAPEDAVEPVVELEGVGHHERHLTVVGRLLGGKVQEPVLEECLHVVEERRGRREHGEVAGPAEALVALRAVGGHVEEVAPEPPHHVARGAG